MGASLVCGHEPCRLTVIMIVTGRYGVYCGSSTALYAKFFLTPFKVSVNASIVADTGGTCVCTVESCADDPVYTTCTRELYRDLITSTAASSALSSFLMGLLANLPVGMAPGLNLNAYVSSSNYNYILCVFGREKQAHC